jgi:hypothetical protein
MKPTLTRNGPASYYCAMPAQISAWLVEQGYTAEDGRSKFEYLRLRRGRSLIIAYHNGTVLLQGADVQSAHALLSTLVVEPDMTAALPF